MPSGVYKRTEFNSKKQKEIARRNAYKLHKLPRTQVQIEAGRKVGKLPKTLLQTGKGRSKPHEGNIFGDDIVKHHNDLCHGALRPDDITCMTHSKHIGLHAKLRYQERDNKGRFISKDKE